MCRTRTALDLKDLNPGNGDIIDGATLLRPWHGGVSGLPWDSRASRASATSSAGRNAVGTPTNTAMSTPRRTAMRRKHRKTEVWKSLDNWGSFEHLGCGKCNLAKSICSQPIRLQNMPCATVGKDYLPLHHLAVLLPVPAWFRHVLTCASPMQHLSTSSHSLSTFISCMGT